MSDARKPGRFRWLWSAVRVVVLVALLMGVLMWSLQRKLMYPGAWIDHAGMPPRPADVQSWTMDTDAGTIEAWFMLGRGASTDKPGPAVVFMHGNGELIDFWPDELRPYAEAGISVLMVEYRGYGRSAGKPSQRSIMRDLVRWRDLLAADSAVDAERLVYHGRSLGGGYAAQLAKKRPPAALILSSTFTSMTELVQDIAPLPTPGFLIRDSLRVRDVVAELSCPVLVLHGDDDELIEPRHARRNAAAAADGRLVIYPGAGHDTMPNGNGEWSDLFDFLTYAEILRSPPDDEDVKPPAALTGPQKSPASPSDDAPATTTAARAATNASASPRP